MESVQRTQNDFCSKSSNQVNFKDPAKVNPLKVNLDCSRSSETNKEHLDFKVKYLSDSVQLGPAHVPAC